MSCGNPAISFGVPCRCRLPKRPASARATARNPRSLNITIVFILYVQPPLFTQETAEPLRFSPAELVD